MALTQEQIAQEKANEAKLNKLSDEIIGKTPFGKLYPLMRLAASIGEGAIPHKICVSADGREVTVYKGEAGKVVGAWLKPTHEYVTMYASRGEYGKAIASVFGIYGQLTQIQEQKKATCFTVTPNQIVNLVKSVPSYDPNTGQRRAGYVAPGSSTNNTATKPIYKQKAFIIPVVAVGSLAFLFIVLKVGKVI